MSRFGIWQPMQSLAGLRCRRAASGILQLWLVWQVRAFGRKVGRRLFAGRLHMGIVAGDARHAAAARAIALAQGHGVVMLNVVCRGRGFRQRRNHQNGKCLVQRTSRTNILVCLSGLEYAGIAGLMTGNTNVVRKVRRQTSRIGQSAHQRPASTAAPCWIQHVYAPRRGRDNSRSQWPTLKKACFHIARWSRQPGWCDRYDRKCTRQ